MPRFLVLLALAALAACGDQPSATEPRAAAVTSAELTAAKQPGSAALLGPLDDAVVRIGPALGASADAGQARTLLASVHDHVRAGRASRVAGTATVTNLLAALDRLQAADPALAAECDAVRLSVAPLR